MDYITVLNEISLNVKALLPSFSDKTIEWVSAFSALFAVLFSLFVYLNSEFKEKFNFLTQQIANTQHRIFEHYFFDQLDNVYNQGNINFNKLDFSHSRIYCSLIKFNFELLSLIDKSKLGKKYTISLLKTILRNETVWLCAIFCLQEREIYDVSSHQFKTLWRKYKMYEGMTLFDDSYGIDELGENEINNVDERRFAFKTHHQKMLAEITARLSEK